MTNSGVGRDNQEIVERLLRPPQQLVALPVAGELQAGVDAERVGAGEHVRDHRVIDHQLRGDQRVDSRRVPAQRGHRITHRDQVDHARDAGEILHQHPRRGELDLGSALLHGIPRGQRRHLLAGDQTAVLVAHHILQQHPQAVGQSVGGLHPVQAKDVVAFAVDNKPITGAETVQAHDGAPSAPGV